MDFYAAKSFVEQGGVTLALEENLMGESQAIAVPEGAEALKAELDQVIQELMDEGFIDELVQQYLVEEAEEGEVGEEVSDATWEKIQAEGKIVVGTSADYPPFEFINEENEFDGFDIVLMEEIANRLGVEIEWQDIAFDGLIAALQAGKIDSIIAAMAATPERDEQVDFTINYYEGSDAILVQEGSDLAFSAPEEIAGYKIGVQSGTIHEQWVQENLIDAGDMDEADLVRYERADQAALDLKNGRLEVVVMDFYAAKSFVEQGGVTLALEENLMGESQAIAVPEGAAGTKWNLDQVIQELMDEGFVDELVQQYLVEE
jgi:polar amino acid transport system substrate-binding protein